MYNKQQAGQLTLLFKDFVWTIKTTRELIRKVYLCHRGVYFLCHKTSNTSLSVLKSHSDLLNFMAGFHKMCLTELQLQRAAQQMNPQNTYWPIKGGANTHLAELGDSDFIVSLHIPAFRYIILSLCFTFLNSQMGTTGLISSPSESRKSSCSQETQIGRNKAPRKHYWHKMQRWL